MSIATVLLLGENEQRVEVLTLEPADAKEILARHNTHNRSLRPVAIANYARDMAAGNWRDNGETIKFATDGTLLDGQHRLAAIVAAGVAVRVLVVTGLDPQVQETMDSGRRRTTADALGLRGEKHSPTLAAVVRRVWMWERGDHRLSGKPAPTTAECAELLASKPELRRSAEIAERVHGQFRYLPQSIVGTAHHLFTAIDLTEAAWYFVRLADGAELPANHPILTLRNRVMSERADRHRIREDRSLAYLIRTWNALRDGRELARIIQAPDAAMPMPK